MHVTALVLVFASAAGAQLAPTTVQPPFITVHGDGTATAEPDQAQLQIGVVTQAKTAIAATEENARQSRAVADQLNGLVPPRQIKTENFSVTPNYEYPKNGGAGVIQSFTANNTVNVIVDDLSKLSQIVDRATASGANTLGQLSFSLKDDRGIRAQALKDAASHAEESSRALASSLNVTLGPILHVEEGPARPVPLPFYAMSETMGRAKAVATPISTGTIEVHADVTITYSIKN